MNKILLIGIFGTYNYGCEAIVRGTVNQIRSVYPDCQIDYASVRPVEDRRRLSDCDVNIIELEPSKRYSKENIIRKLCAILKIDDYQPYQGMKKLIKQYDALFSIGGDIYTLLSDNRFNTTVSRIGDLCFRVHVPYILWGCSVGPFDKNNSVERKLIKHLKQVTRIVCREKATVEYLKTVGVLDNVRLLADPAFYVNPIEPYRTDSSLQNRKKIGINLSPLSALHYFGSLDEAMRYQAEQIDRLIEQTGCDILFLPHVISSQTDDNDLSYMQLLKDRLRNKEKCKIVDNDPGFIGIKSSIKSCDVVISSRMHCNINTICCGVPTLFLSYSLKSKGMVDFVYHNPAFLMDIKQFSADTIIRQISELFKCTCDVKGRIEQNDIAAIVKQLI